MSNIHTLSRFESNLLLVFDAALRRLTLQSCPKALSHSRRAVTCCASREHFSGQLRYLQPAASCPARWCSMPLRCGTLDQLKYDRKVRVRDNHTSA
jgi:hypothetical protein